MNTTDLSPRANLRYGLTGLVVIVVLAGLMIIGIVPFHSGATYYTASFGRAGQGLDPQSDVKIRGIAVGGVESVRLDSGGRATVRFRVDSGIRVPETASVGIEPVSVFGPKDLVLTLGSGEGTGPYLADNATITKTSDPQELSDTAWPLYKLTNAINPEEAAGIVHTFAQGLQGEGPALRRTIGNANVLVGLAYDRRGAIGQALKDLDQLAATFGNRGDEIVGLTADANALQPALNGNPDKITQLLDGTDRLTTGLNADLNNYGGRLGPLVDAAGATVGTVYVRRNDLVPLMGGLVGFFGGISNIIRVPGPQNTLLAQAYNYLPLDLCQTLVDVCTTKKAGAK